MRNFIFTILVSFFTITTVFAKMPDGVNYEETNKEVIQKWINDSSTTKTFYEQNRLNLMLLIAGMNPANTSYSMFKKVFVNYFSNKDMIEKYGKGNKDFTTKNVESSVTFFIIYSLRFNGYIPELLKDSEIKNSDSFIRHSFIRSDVIKYLVNNKDEFRKYFKATLNLNAKENNIRYVTKILENYGNELSNVNLGLTKDEISEDLRFAKLLVFPNLTKSDEWKQACIKIELMIKSNQ